MRALAPEHAHQQQREPAEPERHREQVHASPRGRPSHACTPVREWSVSVQVSSSPSDARAEPDAADLPPGAARAPPASVNTSVSSDPREQRLPEVASRALNDSSDGLKRRAAIRRSRTALQQQQRDRARASARRARPAGTAARARSTRPFRPQEQQHARARRPPARSPRKATRAGDAVERPSPPCSRSPARPR